MSPIKSKDTSIEFLVRLKLFSMGYRYRVNYKALPGKPDIAFTKKKIAIFIHGCYWHGHDCGGSYSHSNQFLGLFGDVFKQVARKSIQEKTLLGT